MPRVVYFELNADDPKRAIDFYEKVFGWMIRPMVGPKEYWLVTTGGAKEPGIDGAVKWRRDAQATTVNTLNVPSVDEYCSRIEDCGGKVITPKMSLRGIGYLAYCMDTEGNTFGIMKLDPAAR